MLKLIKNQARANDPAISMLAVLIGVPLGTYLLLVIMALLTTIFGMMN